MPQSDKRPYSDDEEDNTWEDWEDDERGPVKSLFADATFPAVEDALAYDAAHHGFDLRQYRKQVGCISDCMKTHTSVDKQRAFATNNGIDQSPCQYIFHAHAQTCRCMRTNTIP
jgi:hypothetical protein